MLHETSEKYPTVSVIMTCYNASRYIRESIESILKQTLTDFEFIIVDDASVDNTRDIVSEYANKDARIRLLTNKQNLRPSQSANRGLAISQGEFIARMDADDIAFPCRLRTQVNFLQSNPDYVFCGTGHENIDHENNVLARTIEGVNDWECDWISFFRMPIAHTSAMYRQSVVSQNSISYNDDYDGAADFEFFSQLLKFGTGAAVPEILVKYRTHSHNVSTRKKDKQLNAAFRVSLKRAHAEFPSCDLDSLETLFSFIHGQHQPDKLKPKAVLLALTSLERAFFQKHKLTYDQQSVIRQYSMRWIVKAALTHQKPDTFADAMSYCMALLPRCSSLASEGIAYIARRIYASSTPAVA